MKKTPFRLTINAYDTDFSVHIAENQDELDSCFALRTRYFKTDLSPVIDRDIYDEYCCHLIVTDLATNEVVGTYRLMRYDVAKKNIGYYGETEFDLTNIKKHDLKLVEIGRLCTASEYRNKNIVGMLWNGIYEYLDYYNLEYLSGSVSVPSANVGLTSKIYAYAKYKNMLADPEFSVLPLPECVDKDFDPDYIIEDVAALKKELPKLFLAYLVLETKICGPSGHDDVLHLNDFYILSCLKNRARNRRISRFKYKNP
ncbi:MAG: GNAT family N-acetyltransferase [Legionellaceae bacterium]|nr:GNAT family N-acetyltransferase [Legionellaceae bacterium]